MNKFIQYLALASVAAFGLASCVEEAPAYEPAEAAGTAEVFFSPSLPATYNLKGNDGAISVTVSRVQSAGTLTANLSSSAPAEFSVPASVTFGDGSKTASFTITFDPNDLEEDVTYPFTVTILNETTPYGAAEYSFTASVPSAWNVFGTGDLNEVWWGETEPKKTIYYQDLSETLRYCKIEGCFGYETIAAGEDYPVQDYVFYWNTETNQIYIPIRSMGYVPSNYGVPVYYGDESAFYNLYWEQYQLEEGTDEWFDFCDQFRASYPEDYYPYYDGNGGFYLADQYIVGKPGTSEYQGRYNSGSDWDFLICDGFERFTDYNDDAHFGASKALYEGVAESMLFATGSTPVTFEQSLRYDADYEFDPEEDDEVYTTYYLADYFDEGQCLAFKALIPELLEEGAEIEDVDNEQPAGIQVMGQDLYVSVKGGSVSLSKVDGETFPVFSITLNVYTKDAEGTVLSDFGKITEVYKALAYGKNGYTLDDIWGGYKEDYLGTWEMYSTEDGVEYAYPVLITDEGRDEDGTEWVKITNLSGYDGWSGMVDELYATFSNYTLLVPGQDLEYPVTYGGTQHVVSVYPADPDTETIYGQANAILAGICEDGALAFVNRYNGVNLSAFYYQIGDLGGLTMFYNIYGFQVEGASLAPAHNYYDQYTNRRQSKAVNGGKAMAARKISGTSASKRVRTKVEKAVRSVNVSNCVRREKKSETLISVALR